MSHHRVVFLNVCIQDFTCESAVRSSVLYAVDVWWCFPVNLQHAERNSSERNTVRRMQTIKCKFNVIFASMSLTEHPSGNVVFSFKLLKPICEFMCVNVYALCVHNASSADSSFHRLLVCTTALPSTLISSVNVSLWLIENEPVYASLQCLNKAVKEAHFL